MINTIFKQDLQKLNRLRDTVYVRIFNKISQVILDLPFEQFEVKVINMHIFVNKVYFSIHDYYNDNSEWI